MDLSDILHLQMKKKERNNLGPVRVKKNNSLF